MWYDTSWHDTRLVYISHVWYVTSERHETVDTRRVMGHDKTRHDARLVYNVTSERHLVMCHGVMCYDTTRHDTRLVYIRHIWETSCHVSSCRVLWHTTSRVSCFVMWHLVMCHLVVCYVLTHDKMTHVKTWHTTCLHQSHLRETWLENSCVMKSQNMTHELSTYVTSERDMKLPIRDESCVVTRQDMTHDLSTYVTS